MGHQPGKAARLLSSLGLEPAAGLSPTRCPQARRGPAPSPALPSSLPGPARGPPSRPPVAPAGCAQFGDEERGGG